MKTKSIKILLVEDEPEISEFLAQILTANGYQVLRAGTFNEAVYAIKNEAFDLVLLDLILPDGNGLSLLKIIRDVRGNVPVIVQTALLGDEFCVKALKLGADDFVAKPVRQGPLIARIEAVLRRVTGTQMPFDEMPLRNGAFADYPERQIVFADGKIVRLTCKEAALLRFLFSKNGAPASTDEILIRVWNVSPHSLDASCVPALVSRLRKKLVPAAEIVAVYNGGYALKI